MNVDESDDELKESFFYKVDLNLTPSPLAFLSLYWHFEAE